MDAFLAIIIVFALATIECIRKYGEELYDSMQEPYDEHGACCIQVVDEILNRLNCFTSQAAVDAWDNAKEETE